MVDFIIRPKVKLVAVRILVKKKLIKKLKQRSKKKSKVWNTTIGFLNINETHSRRKWLNSLQDSKVKLIAVRILVKEKVN